MPQVPEGAQRSPDGHYWLDSANQWQPVPADDPQHPNNAAAPSSSSSAGSGEMTREELAAITSEDQIDQRAYPYFEPDYEKYADDASAAQTQDHLSDEPAQGGA